MKPTTEEFFRDKSALEEAITVLTDSFAVKHDVNVELEFSVEVVHIACSDRRVPDEVVVGRHVQTIKIQGHA